MSSDDKKKPCWQQQVFHPLLATACGAGVFTGFAGVARVARSYQGFGNQHLLRMSSAGGMMGLGVYMGSRSFLTADNNIKESYLCAASSGFLLGGSREVDARVCNKTKKFLEVKPINPRALARTGLAGASCALGVLSLQWFWKDPPFFSSEGVKSQGEDE